MQDENHDEADDTDELLCTEVISDFGVFPPRDHCDLLLDAIDAQLSHLQTCSHGKANGGNGKTGAVLVSESLDRSTSVSKDTGLGTDQMSSSPEGLNSDHTDLTTAEPSRSTMELNGLQEDEHEQHVELGSDTSWHTGGAGGVESTKREQCLWRLERLLGTATGITRTEEGDEEGSVRTEDFSARFLEEMLQPTKMSVAGSDFSGSDSGSISSDTTLLTEPQVTHRCRSTEHKPSLLSLKTSNRQLAGVPLKSFDLVTIDSDLDSVCTEQVRYHIQHTLTNRTAQEGLLENGTIDGRGRAIIKTTQRPENQIVSSEDEVNSVCVSHYRGLRSPASQQQREKRSYSRRSNTSNISITSRWKAGEEIKSGLGDVELSLTELQMQKVTAVQKLERLKEEVKEAEKEQHTLCLSVTQSRRHNQLLRSELHTLQAQRDSCVQEVRALQERHIPTVYHDTSPHRHMTSSCVSALEREEMDRLLDNAKSELFSEQRRFRHVLDSIQERLEEVTQELEQKQEQNRKLREKCSQLEDMHKAATKTKQELQESAQSERVEQECQLRALEKIISQKELLLLATQEEKNHHEVEIRAVTEEHAAKLTAALTHAQKQKDVEVEQLRTQMMLIHSEELQRVRNQVHELKEAALKEQAVTHTRHTESLHNRIKMKEEEVIRLQESLKQQQEELRRREDELREETQDKVKRAVEREQRKWEEQRAESLQEQQVRLENQLQEVERRGRAEVEREKRSALALQSKVLKLQKTVEELNSAASEQTALIKTLRDEHQAELYKLHKQLQQETEKEAVRLKECMKQSEQELQGVRAELAECQHLLQGAAARHEQLNAEWAQDIHNECVYLQELLTQNGFAVDNKHLSHSVTVSEALQVLRSLRKLLYHFITSLQNHITSLTHTKQQLSADKDEELRVQKEQLTAEKEKAVNALREKLIQEHIEELSSLKRLRLREDDDGDGMAARLRRQLRAKDEELHQVQRSMVQWKEKTTARLAHKFEQELVSELERWKVDWLRKRKTCRQKSGAEVNRRLEQLEAEMRHLTTSSSEIRDIPASSASSAHNTNTASSLDLDSYKLLRHLQSRIRQLQADTQGHTHTYTPGAMRLHWDRGNTELAGSYLETIAPAPNSCMTQQHSDLRTAQNHDL